MGPTSAVTSARMIAIPALSSAVCTPSPPLVTSKAHSKLFLKLFRKPFPKPRAPPDERAFQTQGHRSNGHDPHRRAILAHGGHRQVALARGRRNPLMPA